LPDSTHPVETRFDAPADVAATAVERFAGRHLLLLTDYDGTLSDIAARPGEARVSRSVLDAFAALKASPAITLGVVSGRRRDDVAKRVGRAAEFVAGLHGLEIRGRGESFQHRVLVEVEPLIAWLADAATRRLAWCETCLLENKRWSLACHVRLVPDESAERALEEFEDLVEPYLESRVLRLLIGSKVMEVLPAVDWHKGRAVDWIRARVARSTQLPVSVLYLGDDRTDEDAFTALTGIDFGIGVGARPHTHMIDARLSGPAAVGDFFSEIANLRR
jgi:trehalose-phosphatase